MAACSRPLLPLYAMSSSDVESLFRAWGLTADGVAAHNLCGSAVLELTFPGRLTTGEASSLLGVEPAQYDAVLVPRLEARLEGEFTAALPRIDTAWLLASRAARPAHAVARAGSTRTRGKKRRTSLARGARCFVLYPERCTDGRFHYFPATIARVRAREPRFVVAWKDGDARHREVSSVLVATSRRAPCLEWPVAGGGARAKTPPEVRAADAMLLLASGVAP